MRPGAAQHNPSIRIKDGFMGLLIAAASSCFHRNGNAFHQWIDFSG
jgi:hypothetical protein